MRQPVLVPLLMVLLLVAGIVDRRDRVLRAVGASGRHGDRGRRVQPLPHRGRGGRAGDVRRGDRRPSKRSRQSAPGSPPPCAPGERSRWVCPRVAALPDIWIPESRLLVSRAYLGAGSRVRTLAPSTARTPLLLVGGRHARRFPTWGAAEVSGLVTVPDPQVSTVGALAVVAPQAEAGATGRTPLRRGRWWCRSPRRTGHGTRGGPTKRCGRRCSARSRAGSW